MLRYAISNGHYHPGDAARWAAQRLDFVQLREKTLDAGPLTALARRILTELADSPTKLLINGRADVALASGAHGIHLTSSPGELTPAQVREIFAHSLNPYPPSPIPPEAPGDPSSPALSERVGSNEAHTRLQPLISVSCHTPAEAAQAHAAGADVVLFGPVFEKRVANRHIQDGSGLRLLAEACRAAAGTPVLALGGITHENTADCLTAGAAGIAAIRLFA